MARVQEAHVSAMEQTHDECQRIADKELERIMLGSKPNKYDNSIHPREVIACFLNPKVCHTKRSVMAAIGIDPETWYKWEKQHNAFSDAVRVGKALQEMNFSTWLATGQIKYAQGLQFVMKNLHNWADKIEQHTTHSLADLVKDTEQQAHSVNWTLLDNKQAISQAPQQPSKPRADYQAN